MASLNTSTGDVQIQFKESESRQYVNENEQAFGGKKMAISTMSLQILTKTAEKQTTNSYNKAIRL